MYPDKIRSSDGGFLPLLLLGIQEGVEGGGGALPRQVLQGASCNEGP